MGDLIQSVTTILSNSQRRAEDAAHNISNLLTPGYRRKYSYASVAVESGNGLLSRPIRTGVISMERGTLSQTDQATDLAIEGEGFFELRDGDHIGFSRNGQLRRDASGRLVDPHGRALQGVGGGDVVVTSDRFEVSPDGSILEDGRVVDRIAFITLAPGAARPGADGLITAAPEEVSPTDQAVVRQGFLESSNVSLGDETIALMEAVRHAETGQRLMNVYDDLMGRAVSTFGQAGQ